MMEIPLPFPAVYPILRHGLLEQDAIYLVGGVVRDILLSRPPNDIDVVVQAAPARVIAIARKTANYFHGGMYALDEDRCTYRVFAQDADGKEWKVDIALMRGSTLAEDLLMRDFTINAIALDVTDNENVKLIDPAGGANDLFRKTIKTVTSHALMDDSIRILRGIRLALEFNLKIDDTLLAAMRDSVSALELISGERFRDELFRLLSADYAQKGLDFLDRIGVFRTLFDPDSSLLTAKQNHTLQQLDRWSTQIQLVELNSRTSASFSGFESEAFLYLAGCISADRSRLALLKLICLFSESVDVENKVDYFALSQQEKTFFVTVAASKDKLLADAKGKGNWTRKDIYRFFKATRDAGPGICFFLLAETGIDLDEGNAAVYTTCQTLLFSYFKDYETFIDPEPLLNGNDIMTSLRISAGPQIGICLERLKEAQVAGIVKDRKGALRFLKETLAWDDENIGENTRE